MSSVNFECHTLKYSDHAVNQMFKRDISVHDIKIILKFGKNN